jgi:hypothetical protein
MTDDVSAFAKDRVGSNGETKTEFQVSEDANAVLEAELKDAAEKKAFAPPFHTYEDWTGHRFVACPFGDDCEDLVQIHDDDSENNNGDEDDSAVVQTEPRMWSFKLGDLQEHKYDNPDAWTETGIPHADTDPIENVHGLVMGHFRPDHVAYEDDHGNTAAKSGDFMSAWAIHEE